MTRFGSRRGLRSLLVGAACLGLALSALTAPLAEAKTGPVRRLLANGETVVIETRNFSENFTIVVRVEGPNGELRPIADGPHRLNDGTVFRTRRGILLDPR